MVACNCVTDTVPDERVILLQCQLMEVFGRYEWLSTMAEHFREKFLPAHPEVVTLLQSDDAADHRRAAEIAITYYKEEMQPSYVRS